MHLGKVLIIDDDSRNIFALKAVLRARGFECITATSAIEGLKLLEDEAAIKVVLLDMMMPEIDGYQTILRIRQGGRSDVPVIAVTAQAMLGDREKCIAAGADGYISKPIDVDQLLELMKSFMI